MKQPFLRPYFEGQKVLFTFALSVELQNDFQILPQHSQTFIQIEARKHQCNGSRPPIDLHWFFEISIRTEKKNSVITEKKFQL